MLKIDGLQAAYGHSQVLFDVSLEVNEGELVTLMGRNGMGKTTTIRTLMGLLAPKGDRSRSRARHDQLQPRKSGASGRRSCAGGPADFPNVDRSGKSGRNRIQPLQATVAMGSWQDICAFPAYAGAGGSDGGHAFRRRTADAGHRACIDDEPASSDPR